MKTGIVTTIVFLFYKIVLFIYKLLYNKKAVETLSPKLNQPKLFLKVLGVKCGDNLTVGRGLVLHNFQRENLTLGSDVSIGAEVFLDLSNKISIGDRCTIAMRSILLTHIDVGKSRLNKFYSPTSSALTLEKDVYLGCNCVILDEVSLIRSGSMIAACSVLKDDTTAGFLYAGTPAVSKKKL